MLVHTLQEHGVWGASERKTYVRPCRAAWGAAIGRVLVGLFDV